MRRTLIQHNEKLPATHDQKLRVSSISADNREAFQEPETSVSKLQQLITAVHTELEILSGRHLLEINEAIDFYSEVMSFEIGLIKGALRRTQGHQGRAARLLNLNPSTLNAKIKQYEIKFY